MPSHTFDAWLEYSADLNAKREVSGKYGGECSLFYEFASDQNIILGFF